MHFISVSGQWKLSERKHKHLSIESGVIPLAFPYCPRTNINKLQDKCIWRRRALDRSQQTPQYVEKQIPVARSLHYLHFHTSVYSTVAWLFASATPLGMGKLYYYFRKLYKNNNRSGHGADQANGWPSIMLPGIYLPNNWISPQLLGQLATTSSAILVCSYLMVYDGIKTNAGATIARLCSSGTSSSSFSWWGWWWWVCLCRLLVEFFLWR